MTNEFAKAEMLSVLDEVQQQMRVIARVQRDRAQLTATATIRKQVTVTVNADGVVIETKFGSAIEELTYPEIAKAVTDAAQQAAADVSRRGQELMSTLRDRRARLPKLSDLVEGMPDLGAAIPVAPVVSTAPPSARERSTTESDEESKALRFTDVEAVDPVERDRGVTDSGW
ncbi:YbaB/EbfC family nucleoid-associated protein [Nocardia shimofusensis]|uniref:YbaB/EbfC family nucleoid-associated protein n=1 Tax=Nocardia shimofusensis TaxID=228596 RepID=UPI000834A9AE|nr:YbaB/EbfC family nucleoid-associated protein [Nocardia shimofusensis]